MALADHHRLNRHSKPELQSRMIIAFFAFVFGSLVSTLIHQKNQDPKRHSELFSLFNQAYSIETLPDDVADKLAMHLNHSQDKSRRLLEVAAWHALEEAFTRGDPKALGFETQLAMISVTDQEVETFWENNRDRIRQPFHEAGTLIRKHLTQEKTRRQLSTMIKQLVDSGELYFNPFFYRTRQYTNPAHASPSMAANGIP